MDTLAPASQNDDHHRNPEGKAKGRLSQHPRLPLILRARESSKFQVPYVMGNIEATEFADDIGRFGRRDLM